jgi:hypothetical protein
MRFLVVIFVFLFSTTIFAQGEFKLIKKAENADINYLTAKRAYGNLQDFQPVKGQYTVYLFMKEFEGVAKDIGIMKFHDLIILKTDKNNIILDGYYYRLEWGEGPMIFRTYTENIKLENNLKVSELEFDNECDDEMIKSIFFDYNDILKF